MPYLAMPLGDRHVVYGSLFDHEVAEFRCHIVLRFWTPLKILTPGPLPLRRILQYQEYLVQPKRISAAAARDFHNPSTTTLPLILGVGQIGEVMPAATAIFCPWPVS